VALMLRRQTAWRQCSGGNEASGVVKRQAAAREHVALRGSSRAGKSGIIEDGETRRNRRLD